MERAEEATVAQIEEEVRPPQRSAIFTAVAIANVLLLGALVWSNRSIAGGVDQLGVAIGRQAEATQQLEGRVAALGAKNDALEREMSELRSTVSAETAEDILFLKIVITKRSIDRKRAREIAHLVQKYSRIYRQDPDLVLAIIAVESDFDPSARSHAGAVGLMQIMPQWKQVLGIREELTDPEASIKYGLQVLGFYRNMYGDLEMALTAYNRGPGPVDAALNRGQSPHNKYAPLVMKTYRELQSLRKGNPA